ncbi:MAG: hypothetical protein HY332_19825 [Chloroflexi bacterium]|nr:hypothetical protein [Chloroflexota bacterium]
MARARFINEHLPEETLYSDAKRAVQEGSRASWRLSPQPFWLDEGTVAFLEQLGQDLFAFYRALNSLYFASVRGTQPGWIAEYFDLGRPDQLIDYGRLNRTRSHLPRVIRPDLFLTEHGFVATELDSVPGGIGFGGSLAEPYAALGFDLVGGATGMVDGFAALLESAAGEPKPPAAIVVSEESGDYWDEMAWLARTLTARGHPVHAVRPQDVHFTEEALLVPEGGSPGPRDPASSDPATPLVPVKVLYRFFELYDIKNVPKWELMLYATKKQRVVLTPPVKSFLEEKLGFALLHHPVLAEFWRRELGPERRERLLGVLPPTWILDPRVLPPHAVVPGIELAQKPVQSWEQLVGLTQKQRRLVLKPSGFSATAWGSRGVKIGHDLPEEEWAAAVHEALADFPRVRWVLQRFEDVRRATVEWFDFGTHEMQRMPGRARLTPYYFVSGDEVRLGGATATVVPIDKKLIHGMVDAVIVPCAIRADAQ